MVVVAAAVVVMVAAAIIKAAATARVKTAVCGGGVTIRTAWIGPRRLEARPRRKLSNSLLH